MFPRDQLFGDEWKVRCNESLLSGILYKKYTNICLQRKKSKQSYVWIDSILEAPNICFGPKIAGLLESFLS